jgi:hypothetical protein
MLPLGDEFEIGVLFLGAHDADRFARAMDDAVLKAPRIRLAVDGREILIFERDPAEASAVDRGLGQLVRLLRVGDGARRHQKDADQQFAAIEGESHGSPVVVDGRSKSKTNYLTSHEGCRSVRSGDT